MAGINGKRERVVSWTATENVWMNFCVFCRHLFGMKRETENERRTSSRQQVCRRRRRADSQWNNPNYDCVRPGGERLKTSQSHTPTHTQNEMNLWNSLVRLSVCARPASWVCVSHASVEVSFFHFHSPFTSMPSSSSSSSSCRLPFNVRRHGH